MKTLKTFFKALLGAIIIAFLYVLFVLDRLIVAFFPAEQKSFINWTDMDIKQELRSTNEIVNSFIRVVVLFILILILNLFI